MPDARASRCYQLVWHQGVECYSPHRQKIEVRTCVGGLQPRDVGRTDLVTVPTEHPSYACVVTYAHGASVRHHNDFVGIEGIHGNGLNSLRTHPCWQHGPMTVRVAPEVGTVRCVISAV